MTKFLIILSVFLGVACCMDKEFLEKSAKRSAENVKDCMDATGVTPEHLGEAMELKIPSRKEVRCLQACYHKKYGIQDANGKLNKTASMEAMKDLKVADPELYEKAVKLFDQCIDDQGDNTEDECDIAANFMYCFNMNGAKMGLKPGMVPL